MAEIAITFLSNKLQELLSREADLILGLPKKIKDLQEMLEWMRGSVKDADADRRYYETTRIWVRQITIESHRAEDIIEWYSRMIKSWRPKRAGPVAHLERLIFYISQCPRLRKLGVEIEEIEERIRKIASTRSRLTPIDSLETPVSPAHEKGRGVPMSSARERGGGVPMRAYPERRAPAKDGANVVGFETEVRSLTEKLVDGEPPLTAISIIGVRGLGKSTLASKVYKLVKDQFACKAWMHVPQKYSVKELIQGLAEAFIGLQKQRIAKLSHQEMVDNLTQYLKENKYLLVVDGICSREAWSTISAALPNEMNGSRVLLTTHVRDVAEFSRGLIHEPRVLTEEDSWRLFNTTAFPNAQCPPMLEEPGRAMVAKCSGLPLAVVVLAGLLSRKPESPSEWSRVLGRFPSESTDKEDQMKKLIALSYDELPYYLRACFLHAGLFPEGSIIEADKLIRLWVAEGLIKQRGGLSLEDVAEDYLKELIDGRMIQMVESTPSEGINKCRIHGLLREFCISEGKEDEFLDILEDVKAKAPPTRLRRLAIHHTDVDKYATTLIQSCPNLRSILFLGSEAAQPVVSTLINHLKLLRVIDLEGTRVVSLPEEIGDMVQLRYLGLRNTTLKWLPDSIGKLHKLQTLDASSSDRRLISAPDTLWDIETLRHVSFPTGLEPPPFVGNLSDLQTLSGVKAGPWVDSWLTNLNNLRTFQLEGIKWYNGELVSDSLKSLDLLNWLFLKGEYIPGTVMAMPDHRNLHTIYLEGPLEQQHRLPRDSSQLPPNLTKLHLTGTRLEKDPMPLLEKLPNLRVLNLGEKSYVGKEMACSSDGFPQLQQLDVSELKQLEKWNVEAGAMQSLQSLKINGCDQLKEIPREVKNLPTLEEFEVDGSPVLRIERIQRIE